MAADLDRLAAALAAAADGERPTPTELAELLWLARELDRAERVTGSGDAAASGDAGARDVPTAPADPPRPSPGPRTPPAPVEPPAPAPSEPRPLAPEPPRVTLYVAEARAAGPAGPLAPTPPMLRHPLPLQRALRPLKRRVPSPTGAPELDEHATADRIARLGGGPDAWLPVLRPAPERWLRLVLVHDSGPTMPVWRPLLRELHGLFGQSGVFRTIAVHEASPDGRIRGLVVPPDGRTVVLVLSDCSGPQWHSGEAGARWYRTLHALARRVPLAVLQPLPERLWPGTALPAVPGRLTAPHPAAPASALGFTPYDPDAWPRPEDAPDALALPVLEADPRWLSHWARLTAAPGGARVPGAAAWLTAAGPADVTAPDPSEADLYGAAGPDGEPAPTTVAERLVLGFRGSASPEAFRLAGHLALGVPHLPVMRLVHSVLEPDPRPAHLAEIIVSGLLVEVPGPPGSYAFRPGVRDLLLRSLPRSERGRTTQLLAERGALIDSLVDTVPPELPVTTSPGAAPEGGGAVAEVSAQTLERMGGSAAPAIPAPGVLLGGRYRLVRQMRPGGSVWRAEDTSSGVTVAVKLYPSLPARGRPAFRHMAEQLLRLRHPNVVAVSDADAEAPTPYLVMEYLEGIALGALIPERLPGALLTRVAESLGSALVAVHHAEFTHGRVRGSRIMLLPDGTVKLVQFVPASVDHAGAFDRDTQQLADLLAQLGCSPEFTETLRSGGFVQTESNLRGLADGHARTALSTGCVIRPPLTYRLLGPLTITPDLDDDAPEIPLYSPTDAAVLSALLLRTGHPLTRAELADAVWGPDDRPQNPDARLAACVSRLRGAGAGLIAEVGEGYAVHTSADRVDVTELLNAARAADTAYTNRTPLTIGSTRAMVQLVLDLYEGTPLDGVPGPGAEAARAELTELRLTLLALRADLDRESRTPRAPSAEATPEPEPATILPDHASVLFSAQDGRSNQLSVLADRLARSADLTETDHTVATSSPHLHEVLIATPEALDRLLESVVTQLAGTAADLQLTSDISVTFWPKGVRIPKVTPRFFPAPLEVAVSARLVAEDRARVLGLRPVGDPPTHWVHQHLSASAERQLAWVLDESLRHREQARSALVADLNAEMRRSGLAPTLSSQSPARQIAASVLGMPRGRRALIGSLGRHVPDAVSAAGEALDMVDDQGLTVSDVVAALQGLAVQRHRGHRALCASILAAQLDCAIHLGGSSRHALEEVARAALGHEDGLRVLAQLIRYTEGPDAADRLNELVPPDRRPLMDSVPGRLDRLFQVADSLIERPPMNDPAFRQNIGRVLASATSDAVVLPGTDLRTDALALAHAALSNRYDTDALLRLTDRPATTTTPDAPDEPAGPPPESLVRGPLDLPAEGVPPAPGTTLVYVRANGHLTTGPPGRNESYVECYEVDVRTYTYPLDDVVPGARAVVRVTDPATAAGYPVRDLPYTLAERLAQAAASDLATTEALEARTLPGCSVDWLLPDVQAAPAREPLDDVSRLIDAADSVLLGFEGLLVDLYPRPGDARRAALEMTELVMELRDPEETLSGAPLDTGTGRGDTEPHPLDVLRTFARHPRLSRPLHERLDRIEARALGSARAVAGADELVRALHAAGLSVAVVSDVASHVVRTYVERRSLPVQGAVQGRGHGPALLLPHPDALRRTMQPGRGVVIGSHPAELEAATSLGLPFLGYAESARAQQELERAGARHVFRDLSRLTDIVRMRNPH
ncbi:SAV_2336 N-terminal domain-related protein [Streptomyces sp. NPDC050145]|uniref:SAV_2336 N-terminal domain-related protein n=1 Tax=Streptomyces sp. NPDC050145 TaxID=3365602 RepID=UPI0037B3FA6D